MKKISVVLIAVLLSVTCSLLFFQWKGYSEQRDDQDALEASQEVSLVHKNGMFHVDQRFRDMKPGTYKIVFPANSKGNECRLAGDKECEWTIKGETVTVHETSDIQFSYLLPAPKRPDAYLLDRWLITLGGVSVNSTKIQLAEKDWRGGTWAGAADMVGKSEKDLLDYYVFNSRYSSPTLYWEAAELVPSSLESGVTVFAEKPPASGELSFDLFGTTQKPLYWVISAAHAPVRTDSLLVTASAADGKQRLQEDLIMEGLKNNYQLPSDMQWQLDIAASVQLGKPAGTDKAKKMYVMLTESIEKEKLALWLEALKEKQGGELDSNSFDLLLQSTSGYKTDFFYANRKEAEPVLPLMFYDSREIFINDAKAEDVSILYVDDKPYMSLAPLLSRLGYTPVYNDGKIDAVKNAIRYQFFPDKQLFILNNTKYGLQSEPVIVRSGRAFIDLSLINTFFNVPAVETDEAVTIISPGSEQE